MKNKYSLLSIILTLTAVAVAFTPFYSVAYLLIILVAVMLLDGFSVFNTAWSRFILFLSVFLAIIPLVGLLCWLLHIEDFPVINTLGFIGFVCLLYSKGQRHRQESRRIISKIDVVAIIVGLIPIAIISVSYLPSSNHSAALFQLASEGWDNGAHIQMLEDVSSHHGYVYGPFNEPKDQTIVKSNAYPLAWHLSTANFVNGFGGNRFDPHKPIATIAAYMAASLGWMMLACYLFIVCSWKAYERIFNKKLKNASEIVPLVAVALLVQMIVLYGSLASGFTNYIGSVAYLILLAVAVMEIIEAPNNSRTYLLAILFGTVSVLAWFLIFPAIALTLLILVVIRKPTIRESLETAIKDRRFILFGIIGFAAMLLQIYIFMKFSAVGGSAQLNAGVSINPFTAVIGVFPVNQILYTLIIVSCGVFYFSNKTSENTRKLILTLVLPWLLLAMGLFVYQNITMGYTSYYLSKLFGLSLVAAGIIFGGIFISWINTYIKTKYSSFVIPAVSLLIIGIAVIGTGQSTYGLNKLFQRNARTEYSTAAVTISVLKSFDPNSQYIVVFTDHKSTDGASEDNHGRLELRVTHQTINCAYAVTNPKSLSGRLDRLASCADQLKLQGKSIIVITSKSTKNKVKQLHRDNIIIRNT